jgi:transcriptional regulator with PAS, ATPase and Fis domain
MRIGGKETIKVDIRVISATNRDLKDMVGRHLFREDLYYRLNVIPIHIPPLRERRDDIHQFIANTIIRIEKKYGLKRKLNLDCIELLTDYEWKGNVRELENLVEQICIVSDKEIIGAEDIPEYVRQNIMLRDFPYKKKRALGEMTAEFERRVLLHMIERGKTPVEISRDLKVDVTTIRRKLQKYKITRAKSPENA